MQMRVLLIDLSSMGLSVHSKATFGIHPRFPNLPRKRTFKQPERWASSSFLFAQRTSNKVTKAHLGNKQAQGLSGTHLLLVRYKIPVAGLPLCN